MRRSHYPITPSAVRSHAHAQLSRALPWRGFGRLVTAGALIDVLLLAAALGSSLFAVVRRFRFGFSHETARKALAASLPPLPELTAGLLDASYGFGRRALRRRRWVVAIDAHLDPYYGDRRTPGAVGGKKKQGTKYFFGHATACLVHHRHRYTVGRLPLTGGEKPHQLAEGLLGQMSSRGLELRAAVLDAGSGSGGVIRLLQARGRSYAVPLQRCGKGGNRRNASWELPAGSVTTLGWRTERSRQEVGTEAVVALRSRREGKRVYAFGGWGAGEASSALGRARLARRWYRKRFGIETGYRQMREGKARTASKDVAYRLLLVGIGLLIRQGWVWLTWQLARDRGLRPAAWVGELPLRRAWEWLADLIKGKYKEERRIRLNAPLLPLDLTAA